MEAAKEEGLLKTILPPKLEDAGLGDCALPPEAIKEAFFKAANSIRSGAASILSTSKDEDDNEDCIQDPGPSNGRLSDTPIGISPAANPPGPCGNEKGGGLPQELRDEVVTAGLNDALGAEEGPDKDGKVVGI